MNWDFSVWTWMYGHPLIWNDRMQKRFQFSTSSCIQALDPVILQPNPLLLRALANKMRIPLHCSSSSLVLKRMCTPLLVFLHSGFACPCTWACLWEHTACERDVRSTWRMRHVGVGDFDSTRSWAIPLTWPENRNV